MFDPIKSKAVWTFPLAIAMAVTAACDSGGGSSSGSDDDVARASVGAFVDSRVSGIAYKTESGSGVTDSNGQFPYKKGETVTFSIGALELPSTSVRRTVTPLDIFDADINDTRVVNLARYLQTIDDDGNPDNGITVSDAFKDLADETLDFSSPDFDTDVDASLDGRTLVSEADAKAHLQDTLDSIPSGGLYFEVYGMQAGDYENSISGRDLIGTSQGGTSFNVAGYDRFLLFVPADADRLFLDAVGYQGGTQDWLDSIDGDEYMHRESGFDPVSSTSGCSWDTVECPYSTEFDSYEVSGEDYVEREPDNYAIGSTPGENSYYQYSTFGADSMKVYLTSSPIR